MAQSAGAAVAFGTVAVLVELAYARDADATALLAARFAVTAAALWLFGRMRGARSPEGRTLVRLMALGAFGYAFEASLFFAALERAPASVVGLVFYSYPLWTALLAALARLERLRARTLIALALGSSGVALIFSLSLDDPTGPLLALGSALAVAVYLVVAQVALAGVEPLHAATWTAAGAAAVLVPIAAATGQVVPPAAWPHALGVGGLTALAFLGLYGGIARLGSARAAIATMLEPVTTVVLAALVLGEALTLRVISGAALIVAALPVVAGGGDETLASEPAGP
ncbi:MAG TPA: DMT family transporter [Actinomycetota bacterium]|nr:DMT family transporter [Actinomycetota bacterium]